MRVLITIIVVSAAMLSCPNRIEAQSDSLKIDGPARVSAGQLVRLDAVLQPEESALWIVLSPHDLDYEQVDGGRRLIFAVGCQQQRPITVLLLAQQVEEGRIVTRQVRRQIAIGDTEIPIIDEPPEPEEDLTKSPLFKVVSQAWDSIESSAAKQLTSQVAKNFETIAARCGSGQIKERSAIWRELAEANQGLLQEAVVEWEPVGKATQRGFRELGLESIPEHVFHLDAVAAALRSKVQ